MCVLSNCVLVGNQSNFGGGGARQSTNYNCTFINNSGTNGGGGVYGGVSYGCIFSNNTTKASGGGAYQATLYNCILFGNTATNLSFTYYGGGAYQGTLVNCLVVSNRTSGSGGGVYSGYLYNCTVTGNAATGSGGGIFGSIVYNSILYYNFASSGSNYSSGSLAACCSTPLSGGSFTNEPLFINLAGGDFHLETNSPCINSGKNVFVTNSPVIFSSDLDGNPRIVAGTVDIGAYEAQAPFSSVPYIWFWQHGVSIDTNVDSEDPDGDGLNNFQEWIAGTEPTNSLSVLAMYSPSNSVFGVTVSWQSVSGKNYFLQRASDLSAQPAFSTIQSNIAGQVATTIYTDTTATNGGPYFYRVGVQ
jgi:hypothetical protein